MPSEAVLAAYDVAAQVLGNTRAVCRSCYVHPSIPEAYRKASCTRPGAAPATRATMDRKERTVLRLLSSSARAPPVNRWADTGAP